MIGLVLDERLLTQIRGVIEATKPKQTTLLLLTMIGAYLTGSHYANPESFSIKSLLILIVMGYLAIGGTTLLNMYLDVDIDSVMPRTKNRPLPSGRLSKNTALILGIIMVVSSLIISARINPYVLGAVLAGFVLDIYGYTILLKRRSPFSIIVGAAAGAMPALGGWAAATGALDMPGFLLSSLVFFWQPLHVWFLSYFYLEDYKKAGIPTLPLVVEPRVFGKIVLLFLILYVSATVSFALLSGIGYLAVLLSLIGSLRASLMIIKFMKNPDRDLAWRIFKFATPLLASVFILIPLEAILLHIFYY